MTEIMTGEYRVLCSRCRIYKNVMFEIKYKYLTNKNGALNE